MDLHTVKESFHHDQALFSQPGNAMGVKQNHGFLKRSGESVSRLLVLNRLSAIGNQPALLVMNRNHHPACHDAWTGIKADPKGRCRLPRQPAPAHIWMV